MALLLAEAAKECKSTCWNNYWIDSSKTTTPSATMDRMRLYGSAWGITALLPPSGDLMEARSIEHLAEESVKNSSFQLYKSIADGTSSATSSLVSAIVSSALRTTMVQAGLQA